jgi:hypothetical protein
MNRFPTRIVRLSPSFCGVYGIDSVVFLGLFWNCKIVGALDAPLQRRISPRTLALELRLLLVLIRVLDKSFLAPFGHLAVSACRYAVRRWWGEVAGRVHCLLASTRRPVQPRLARLGR